MVLPFRRRSSEEEPAPKDEDEDLEAILEARELSAFEITDDTVGWGGHRIDLPRIEEARERFAHGFGSCSFLEPLDDLNALDLLRPDPAAT